MGRKAKDRIELTDDERAHLQKLTRGGKTEQRISQRSKIVLACCEGKPDTEVAQKLGVTVHTVARWRKRFQKRRLEGLVDAPRSGKPAKYGKETDERILAKMDEPPPKGYSMWNGSLLAKALEISDDYVWRFLRKRSISLQRRRSWCISTDPQFTEKSVDIIGLYVSPSDNALVLCVDEKPCIQALQREQGWLKMPNGRALTGFSHEYKRCGTSTLIAALDVATGMVKAGHYKTKKKVDFMHFLDFALQDVPIEREVHIVLDNFSSHKNLLPSWHKRHPNVKFHFTPTHASWLNQIETWFSILWRGALRGASFGSVRQLCKAIDDFIEVYNENASPFQWRRSSAKAKTVSHSITNLCK
jgi:transposase